MMTCLAVSGKLLLCVSGAVVVMKLQRAAKRWFRRRSIILLALLLLTVSGLWIQGLKTRLQRRPDKHSAINLRHPPEKDKRLRSEEVKGVSEKYKAKVEENDFRKSDDETIEGLEVAEVEEQQGYQDEEYAEETVDISRTDHETGEIHGRVDQHLQSRKKDTDEKMKPVAHEKNFERKDMSRQESDSSKDGLEEYDFDLVGIQDNDPNRDESRNREDESDTSFDEEDSDEEIDISVTGTENSKAYEKHNQHKEHDKDNSEEVSEADDNIEADPDDDGNHGNLSKENESHQIRAQHEESIENNLRATLVPFTGRQHVTLLTEEGRLRVQEKRESRLESQTGMDIDGVKEEIRTSERNRKRERKMQAGNQDENNQPENVEIDDAEDEGKNNDVRKLQRKDLSKKREGEESVREDSDEKMGVQGMEYHRTGNKTDGDEKDDIKEKIENVKWREDNGGREENDQSQIDNENNDERGGGDRIKGDKDEENTKQHKKSKSAEKQKETSMQQIVSERNDDEREISKDGRSGLDTSKQKGGQEGYLGYRDDWHGYLFVDNRYTIEGKERKGKEGLLNENKEIIRKLKVDKTGGDMLDSENGKQSKESEEQKYSEKRKQRDVQKGEKSDKVLAGRVIRTAEEKYDRNQNENDKEHGIKKEGETGKSKTEEENVSVRKSKGQKDEQNNDKEEGNTKVEKEEQTQELFKEQKRGQGKNRSSEDKELAKENQNSSESLNEDKAKDKEPYQLNVSSSARQKYQAPAPESVSEELLLKRQAERSQLLKSYCQRRRRAAKIPNRKLLMNIVVLDNIQLLFCATPKAASTEWRQALINLTGHVGIQGKLVQNRTFWKHLDEYSRENISAKVQKYYKFLFVREPYGRLLSAYKSKFLANNVVYRKSFGRGIIRQFRKNATKHALETGDDVTFLEFVQHVISSRYYDDHWRSYEGICHMCSIDYDFIGHLETIDEDAPFVLRQAGIDGRVSFTSNRRTRTSSDLLEYYSQIPSSYIRALQRIYSKDSEMFGYSFPEVLKQLVDKSSGHK